MPDIPFILGFLGLIILLIAFLMNVRRHKHNFWETYLFLNFAGSALLAYYALSLNSIPFLVLEAVWAVFSLFKLFQKMRK
ncbi:MAG TPA: hypothetical protein HA222_05040 [Candidatus Diapherotrites archaeon]|uniref:CBU-0592-like domain-containing protein n=1 Tax=Candidatus Iainarchaeum sp. TaxID=3101447 RepID=A0A7J4KS39_9ARCH|nr:hypothetical protein [Candidatus Diapherotrites archaeon]HIH32841.1 hypothetical protein [Candidatus Diapherotrites archaeon]